MTFAIIAPALIVGAFADRDEALGAVHLHGALVADDLFAGGALDVGTERLGRVRTAQPDFAGGTMVHVNAGIAGLMCFVLGKRVGYGTDNMAPYNLAYTVIGASLLWVGWFGFNAGSAVGSNGRAGMAMA